MRLLHQISLSFQEGRSDKVYEIDLCEVGAEKFVVNFRYGRRGAPLREGTRTRLPVELPKAQVAFEKLLDEKERKGYSRNSEFLSEDYAELLGVEPINPGDSDDEQLASVAETPEVATPAPAEAIPESASAEDEKNETSVAVELPQVLVYPGRGAASREAAILQWLEYYTKQREGEKPNWSLSGVVRRAGALKLDGAQPALCRLLAADAPAKLDLVWALGQCGGDEAVKTLSSLSSTSINTALGRVIHESLSRLLVGVEKGAFLEQLCGSLPKGIQDALLCNDPETLSIAIESELENREEPGWLYGLSLLEQAACRAALLASLSKIELGKASMQIAREIFQTAIQRGDAVLFGVLFVRFDGEQELPYSKRGRSHFRNFLWKTLLKGLEENPVGTEQLLFGVLGQLSDDSLKEEDSLCGKAVSLAKERVDWEGIALVDWLRLWNVAPAEVVRELAGERCEAAGVLGWGASEIDAEVLDLMLNSPYEEARKKGLSWARERIEEPQFFACLGNCELEEATEVLTVWLDERIAELRTAPKRELARLGKARGLMRAILVHKSKKTRGFAYEIFEQTVLSGFERRSFAYGLVDWLIELESGKKSVQEEMCAFLLTFFARECRDCSEERLLSLLSHKHGFKQEFAAEILKRKDVSLFSDEIWLALCGAKEPSVRSAGTGLLAKCPKEVLQDRLGLLLGLCRDGEAEVRLQIRAILERLVESSGGAQFASNLISQITS